MKYPTTPETFGAYDTPAASDDEAIRLWKLIYGNRLDRMQVWSAFRAAGSTKLANSADHFYGPDELDQALAWALEQDRMGREVYFCAHQLVGDERTKVNAATVCSLWADEDDGDLSKSPITPSAVVESSPDKHHAYVRTVPMAPDKAEEFNKRWALAIGADPSGFDLTQLLRVPGTRNHKYAGWPEVRLVSIDENAKPYTVAQLEKLLPPLPRATSNSGPIEVPEALSADNAELLETLAEQKPVFRKLWAGDVSNYADKTPSDVDYALIRDLLRATGLDADRTEHLMRQSALARTRNGKWDDKRSGKNYLRYSIDRAIKSWDADEAVNASEYRSLAQHQSDAGRCTCPDCPYRRQIMLIGELVKADLTPIFKVVLLRLAMLVGWHQSKGEASFTGSAVKIAESIHGVSPQKVREVLHAIERRNRGVLMREDGLVDLDVEHVKIVDKHPLLTSDQVVLDGGDVVLEYSEFRFTPVTQGAYLGFFEALVDYVPVLPVAPPKRARRKKEDAVPLPPRVVMIPGHPEHAGTVTVSEIVTCAEGGEDMVEERRYYRPSGVNASEYRSLETRSPWLLLGDSPKRSLPAGEQDSSLIQADEHACHACGSIADARWGPTVEVNGVWLHGYPSPCRMPVPAVAVAS